MATVDGGDAFSTYGSAGSTGMVVGALLMGRSRAEARMTETVIAGPLVRTEDPVTFEPIDVIQEDQSGPAQVKYPTMTVSERGIPGGVVGVADIVVKRPVDSDVLPVGQWFEVTASTVDPSLVGRRFRVKAAPQSGQVTAHRYPVVEES